MGWAGLGDIHLPGLDSDPSKEKSIHLVFMGRVPSEAAEATDTAAKTRTFTEGPSVFKQSCGSQAYILDQLRGLGRVPAPLWTTFHIYSQTDDL